MGKKRKNVIIVVTGFLLLFSVILSLFLYARHTQPDDRGGKQVGNEAQEGKGAEVQPDLKYLDTIADCDPGSILKEEEIMPDEWDAYFQVSGISGGIYERMIGKSYVENNHVSLGSLRYIKLIHYNYEHRIQVGEMVVHVNLAEDYRDIFKRLYQAEYEIQSMYLIENYWNGDGVSSDTASAEANNTYAFCYRIVPGSDHLSNHAYGCAIDINPQQNPYITVHDGQLSWSNRNADEYVNRDVIKPHMIYHEDLCYQVFAEHGFTWGGDWYNPLDYQHFEKEVYETRK